MEKESRDTMSSPRFAALGANTMGLTWIDRLDAATTPVEVMELARVYLAHVSLEEFAALPAKCRPRKLVDAQDLAEYALDLVRETCVDPEPPPMTLKLAAVISHASTRISELSATANDSDTQEA